MFVFYILVVFLAILGLVTLISSIINKFLKHKCENKHYLLIKFNELHDINMQLKLLIAKLNWCNFSEFDDVIVFNDNEEIKTEIKNICKLYNLKYIGNINDFENIL